MSLGCHPSSFHSAGSNIFIFFITLVMACDNYWGRIGTDCRKLGVRLRRKEGNVLFNNTLNTFYSLYIEHIINDHSNSGRGNLLPSLQGLFFSIISKGSFIYTIPQERDVAPW